MFNNRHNCNSLPGIFIYAGTSKTMQSGMGEVSLEDGFSTNGTFFCGIFIHGIAIPDKNSRTSLRLVIDGAYPQWSQTGRLDIIDRSLQL